MNNEQTRRRYLQRAIGWLPFAAIFLGVGFGMEAMGWGTTEVLEMPLHVWIKLPGGIALIIGAFSLRGYLRPGDTKPLF